MLVYVSAMPSVSLYIHVLQAVCSVRPGTTLFPPLLCLFHSVSDFKHTFCFPWRQHFSPSRRVIPLSFSEIYVFGLIYVSASTTLLPDIMHLKGYPHRLHSYYHMDMSLPNNASLSVPPPPPWLPPSEDLRGQPGRFQVCLGDAGERPRLRRGALG